MSITYVHKPNAAIVKLDGKEVGYISHVPFNGGGWTYWPKGSKEHGEVFKTIDEVKRSLEEPEPDSSPNTAAGTNARGHTLNSVELATVLAALRYWQREGLMSAGHEQDIACDGGRIEPLNDSQIEALCERLNCGEAPLQRAPLSDHEGPARSLVIRTSKGDDIEVLPEEAPGLFDEWAEWAEAQEKAVATAEDWTKVLGAADGYLSSLPLGSTGMDETAEDVRAIR